MKQLNPTWRNLILWSLLLLGLMAFIVQAYLVLHGIRSGESPSAPFLRFRHEYSRIITNPWVFALCLTALLALLLDAVHNIREKKKESQFWWYLAALLTSVVGLIFRFIQSLGH
jgi:multisubunit Na+/H+ antiporter MnhC subunit